MSCGAVVRGITVGVVGVILVFCTSGCRAPASGSPPAGGTATFTVPDVGLSLSLSSDTRWRTSGFQFGAPATVAEWSSADGQTAGLVSRGETTLTVEEWANAAEEFMRKREGIQSYVQLSAEKLSARTPGAWLKREYVQVKGNLAHRQVVVFIKQGQGIVTLYTWCPENRWESLRDEILREISSLECTGVRAQPADAQADGTFRVVNEFGYEIHVIVDGNDIGTVEGEQSRDFSLRPGTHDVAYNVFDEDIGTWMGEKSLGRVVCRSNQTSNIRVSWK